MTRTVWRAVRQPGSIADEDLIDVRPLTDAINRLASKAVLIFQDPNGDKQGDYPRGQRVELEYSKDTGQTWTQRASGWVQDTVRNTEGGVDRVTVNLVGYDHFLTTEKVYREYISTSLNDIVQDLIENFTPVTYDASLVNLEQGTKTITRDFQGESVRAALSEITSQSADEDFGVNDDFKFFLEKRETTRAGSDITDGDWFAYDLPEQGRASVNRVELFYGQAGSRARVIVEDRAQQRELKDRLGAASNVVISKSVTYPEIGNEDAAEAKAREILERREPVLKGTIRTFDREDMEPGEVFRLQIGEKNLDKDFRIAQVDYFWQRGETIVTAAEDVADVEDLLVSLADTVHRVSSRDADPDATFTQFLDLRDGVEINTRAGFTDTSTASDGFLAGFTQSFAGFGSEDIVVFVLDTTRVASVRLFQHADDVMIAGFGATELPAGFVDGARAGFARGTVQDQAITKAVATTPFLNAVRDAWQGENPPEVTQVALGTDGTDPVSTDTDLGAEVVVQATLREDEFAATVIRWADQIIPDGDLTSQTIQEFGIKDANGALWIRGTFEAFTPTRQDLILVSTEEEIQDDPDRLGVITTVGQQRIVDTLLGGTGHEATIMVFGTGTADPDEGDTALGNQVASKAVSFQDRSRGVSDVDARLATGDANGNDLSELGEKNASGELLSRVVYEALSKTSDFALDANHRFVVINA